MAIRCDLTDLLVEQCAHCQGHGQPTRSSVVFTMTARRDGRCGSCDGRIVEGVTTIGKTDDGDWICSVCIMNSAEEPR